MAKDPAERYATAGALAADARAALDPAPVPDAATVPVAAAAGPPRNPAPPPAGRAVHDGGPDGPAPYHPIPNGQAAGHPVPSGPAPSFPAPSIPAQDRSMRSRPLQSRSIPDPGAPWPQPAPEPVEETPPPRPRRAVLAGALVLGALAHVLVLENVSFETGLLFWTLSGTLFGTLTAGALRPRRWGSGRTTTLLVLTLPVVLVAVFLVALGLGLAESGTAIVVATLGVYGLWALTFWRRRTRRTTGRP
jgi:hypothetical protein